MKPYFLHTYNLFCNAFTKALETLKEFGKLTCLTIIFKMKKKIDTN